MPVHESILDSDEEQPDLMEWSSMAYMMSFYLVAVLWYCGIA